MSPFLLTTLLLLAPPAAAPGAAAAKPVDVSPLKATEITVCEEIVDRGCRAPSRSFGPDVENVTFLSKIDGATGEAFVTHVWTFEGKEVRRVRLPVRTASFRTWSSKRVKGLPGKWRVEVFDPLGRSIGIADFAVEPPRTP
jgi:hypothetical protein